MGDADFLRKSLFMLGGLLIWGAHFGVVYIFNALACARRFDGLSYFGIGIVPLTVLATTVAALLATLGVLILAFRRRGPARLLREPGPANDFMRNLTASIAALSMVAIAWNGLPVLLTPPCG